VNIFVQSVHFVQSVQLLNKLNTLNKTEQRKAIINISNTYDIISVITIVYDNEQ